MKKSQVTFFIIVGMVILVMVALSLTLLDIETDPPPDIDRKYLIEDDLKPVRVYVESCLEEVASSIIRSVSAGGGTLSHDNIRFFENVGYRYLCDQQGDICTNKILKREDMEEEISRAIERDLQDCVNLNVFREQGFSINTGEVRADTTIILNEVEIILNYPMHLERGTSSMRIEDFSSSVEKPLGKFYLLANNILNQELTQGYFDHVNFMKEDGVDVKIKKQRPYPDIIYSLTSEDLTFNFALEGVDTVSQIDFLSDPLTMETEGCCYIEYDNACYKNVPRLLCEKEDGIYDPDKECECPELEPSGVEEDDEFMDCETTYNITSDDFTGPKREHGESWCNYGSIAGEGRDYVGSRHYLHYCIDGVEYVEECRDFREEVCTQEEDPYGTTQAVCRPNRWEDCSECSTKECCEDSEYRDCVWKENLPEGEECVPEVPPGLRFWEESGRSVCAEASQTKECEGFSCGDEWVTGSAELCITHGDCGNYRNIEDVLTEEGFYHTDFRAEVNEKIYKEEGLNVKGNYGWLNLSIFERERAPVTDLDTQQEVEITELEPDMVTDILRGDSPDFLTLGQTTEKVLVEALRDMKIEKNFMKIMSSVYSYLDSLSKVSLSELKDGETGVSVENIALCDLWRAPTSENNCSICHESDMYTCTEYKCKSLGQDCVYEEAFGEGRCHQIKIDYEEIPEISFDKSSLENVYTLEEDKFRIKDGTAKGYKIKDGVAPYDELSFEITSEKDTICSMTYIPKVGEIDPTGFYVSATGFSDSHEIDLSVPPKPEMPERILDFLNASNSSEFIDLFAENKEKIEELEEEKEFKEIFENIFGKDFYETGEMPELVKLLSSDFKEYRRVSEKVFNAIEEGSIYMFFYCRDRAGNENEKPKFLKLPIKNETSVEEPPQILGGEPEDEGKFAFNESEIDVKFYLNEPSVCRYSHVDEDYEEMENIMDCTISRFDIETEHGGSYLCESTIEANESIELYVRCRDNPERIKEFDFSVKRMPTEVNKTKVQVEESEIKEEIIRTDANNTEIVFYQDDPMSCSLAYSPGREAQGECGPSGTLEKGQYNCVFNMSTNESVYEELRKEELYNNSVPYNISNDDNNSEDLSKEGIEGNNESINEKNTDDEKSYLPYNISANILCRDREPEEVNINQESFVYELEMSDELRIIDYTPKGDVETLEPVISVETSESKNINCGYYVEEGGGIKDMEALEGNRFSASPVDVSKGMNNYNIVCRDAYGNEVEEEISFYVVG